MLTFSDIRLLPPTYQGVSIVSNEVDGLTLQGGRLRSTSLRNEAGDDRMRAMLGRTPQAALSDAFNYAGGDYAFNGKRTSFGLWYAQLEDIYNQSYIGLKHSEPLGDWILGANLGYYDSQADGGKLAGNVDNQLSARCCRQSEAVIPSISAIRPCMATALFPASSRTSRLWAMRCPPMSSPSGTSAPAGSLRLRFCRDGQARSYRDGALYHQR